MRLHSQGNAPPRSLFDAHLRKHIHPDNDTRRIGTVKPRPAGGRPMPDDDAGTQLDFGFGVAPLADDANRRLAAALRQRLDVELGVPPLAVTPLAGRPCPASPTVMGSLVAAIADLPDLEQPVDSYIWRETFMQHARRANAALADFHRELDNCVCLVDTLRE